MVPDAPFGECFVTHARYVVTDAPTNQRPATVPVDAKQDDSTASEPNCSSTIQIQVTRFYCKH